MAMAEQEVRIPSDEQLEARMSPEVRSIYHNLKGIRDKLFKIKHSKQIHTMDDLRHYQQMLDAIDSKRGNNGVFAPAPDGFVPPGQAACREVLDEAYDLIEDLKVSASEMNADMFQTYRTLCGIERKLKWFKSRKSCSWEDLRHYQQMVNGIDSRRVDGIFCGSPTTNIPAGQAACADALDRCYKLLDELKEVAVDMNSEMKPVYNALVNLRDTLEQLKATASMSTERLGNIQAKVDAMEEKVSAIDVGRHEGIFAGSLAMPSGQLLCADLLAQCRQVIADLRMF